MTRTDKNRKRILIIDDDPSLCEVMSTALAGDAYQTFTAHTAKQGIEICSWDV